jgi:hypothetical protein
VPRVDSGFSGSGDELAPVAEGEFSELCSLSVDGTVGA